MGNPSATPTHPADPFAGYPPQSIDCEWLTEQDKKAAQSAEISLQFIPQTFSV